MSERGEFVIKDAYQYNRSSPVRWIISHIMRYRWLFFFSIGLNLCAWFVYSYARVLIGDAAGVILNNEPVSMLAIVSLGVLACLVFDGVAFLSASLSIETVGQRFARDARQELYESLLAKSQSFHNQQRVGDIMARATEDVSQISVMMNPGIPFIFEIFMGFFAPLTFIAMIRVDLLIVPILFIIAYGISVYFYAQRLQPVVGKQRHSYGVMNAGLEESISGIEIVKASAQEGFERRKFWKNAKKYRDYYAEQGHVEARYLPLLFYAFALGLTFLHSMLLFSQGFLTIPDVISVMALMELLRFPTFISIFSLSLVSLGIEGSKRILHIINAKADMDENNQGFEGTMRGEIAFANVSFGYEDEDPILRDISFHVKPGETVAIVGQTGSGKSTLTDLINRAYDITAGEVLIDGVDVREWNLDSLRSQIAKIEQDVFLFSRSIADNIAFGVPGISREKIVEVAKEAQAHEFIMAFKDGYDTEIGERGVMLSGGQRQRLALARAFLSDPRILVLDDSTSAIDSATEDEIQKAILKAKKDRTTLLITHRLSQIRWADHILVMEGGQIMASGTHDDLLRTSEAYRRIFSRYDAELPPMKVKSA